MKCWKCHRELDDDATACPHCETELTESAADNPETMDFINDWLSKLPEDTKAMLQEYAENCDSAEEFANAIMVGPCVACHSNNVTSLDEDPTYDDATLGHCLDCGTIWCTECDHVLEKGELACPRAQEHEEEFEEMFPEDEDEDEDFDTPDEGIHRN